MDADKVAVLETIFSIVLELDDATDPQEVRMIRQQNWDSLATVSIAAGIESEFGVTLEPADYERMTSFAAVHLLLQEKGV